MILTYIVVTKLLDKVSTHLAATILFLSAAVLAYSVVKK